MSIDNLLPNPLPAPMMTILAIGISRNLYVSLLR
jgi:hypothetical protein